VAVVVAVALLGGAVVALIAGMNTLSRTDDWSEATGVVVDVDRERKDGDDDYDTTIRFEDTDGISYTFRSEFGSSSSREGDRVNLRYP
jgi:hypothetical protein